MKKESTKKNWDTFWERKSNLAEVYPNSDRIRRNINKFIDLRGKKVLEIGAGTGRDSFDMAKDGADIFMLDYSMPSLKIITDLKKEQDTIFAVGGDAFMLPFQTNTFDVVFHQGLLEHFRKSDAERMITENLRVVKPGGFLLIDVPQRWHIYTLIKHCLILMNAWFAGWEREFSPGELKKALRKHDVCIVHVYGEWMYPSLFYRMFRELLLKFNIKLPLYPHPFPSLTKLRAKIRSIFSSSFIQIHTALSIGVLARK
jgi:ubiquinone/menaquinone biosynthesis C-methylase UbiE